MVSVACLIDHSTQHRDRRILSGVTDLPRLAVVLVPFGAYRLSSPDKGYATIGFPQDCKSMTLTIPSLFANRMTILAGCASLALAAGCGRPTASGEINDPHETENRSMHAFNVAVDSTVIKPLATAIAQPGGGPVQVGVGNFANNLALPGDVLNSLLQLRLGKAVENTLRFGINSTIGLAGLFDPATAAGVAGKKTDFGETLYVWGVGEGAYLELPLLGPSTQRDALGEVVDTIINPVGLLLPSPESYIGTAARIASKISDRARYSETIDSVLYDSADGYAQARLLYLENRRFELGQTTGDAGYIDPYEDPYAE